MAVEAVDLGGYPRPEGRTAHAVGRDDAVGELAEHKVPPIADAEEVGAFVRKVGVRRIEGLLLHFPMREVGRTRKQSDAPRRRGISVFQPPRDQHTVLLPLLIVKDERIAEVVHLQPVGCGKDEVAVLLPMQEIAARRTEDLLFGQPLLAKMRVVARIKDHVFLPRPDAAARKHIQVLLLLSAAQKDGAVIVKMNEIGTCEKAPRAPLAMNRNITVIPQIKQLELPVFIERDDIRADRFFRCPIVHFFLLNTDFSLIQTFAHRPKKIGDRGKLPMCKRLYLCRV